MGKSRKTDRRMKDVMRNKMRIKQASTIEVIGSPIPSVAIDGVVLQSLTAQPKQESILQEADAIRFVKKAANNVWKLRNKMLDGEGNPKEEFSKVYRFVESLDDALKEIGVVVRSHDGEDYDTGMAVNVIAWEKREGAPREEIIETVKPTIRLGDKLIQWADVVVVAPISTSRES